MTKICMRTCPVVKRLFPSNQLKILKSMPFFYNLWRLICVILHVINGSFYIIRNLLTILYPFLAKYACKIKIQGFSFAFALCMVVPLTITFMMTACGLKFGDPCRFSGMPFYLFWECENGNIITQFITHDVSKIIKLKTSNMQIEVHILNLK